MIWLEADERIEEKEAFENKKTELEIKRNQVHALLKVLWDIRRIGIRQIAATFPSNIDFMDFIYSMPSYEGDAKKAKEQMRWTVKQRKPGEIPEWKKQRQNQNNDTCQIQKTG